jgi:hypothetical protein
VNTCARIETTGWKNKIHISKETAHRLIEMGKGHWFTPRGDKVTAKGKEELETFWLKNIRGGEGRDAVDSNSDQSGGSPVNDDAAQNEQAIESETGTP